MKIAEPWLEPADERRVDEQPVEVHRNVGHNDGMRARGYGAVQVCERFGVAECAHFGHEAREKIERAVGLGDEFAKRMPPVAALLPGVATAAFEQHPPNRIDLIGRRQIYERQVIAAFKMLPGSLERGAAFLVDEPRGGVGKAT